MVSILGDYYYEFPNKIPLKLRLKDMLEERVEEKYYLSDSTIERIAKWNAQQDPLKDIEKEKVISPCLTARGAGEEHSGMVLISEPKCEEYAINTTVKVRKYEVNIEKLKALLKEQKKWLGWTINVIAEYLKRPKTEVEHWFRSDSSFAIPSADIWYELKDLLDIETDEFDKSITEFIEKPNEFESSNRGYGGNGLSPTITATTSPNLVEPKCIGGIGEKSSNNGTQWYRQNRIYDNNIATAVTADFNPYYIEPKKIGQTDNHAKGGIYDANGIARTIMATDYKQPLQILEPTAVVEIPCSTRGSQIASTIRASIHKQGERNIVKNITDGLGYEGVIEPIIYDDYNSRVRADQSCIGTLTTQIGASSARISFKIIEPQYSDYSLQKISENIVKGDTVGAITANAMQSLNHDNCHLVANNYRIRKLTPKECWRLMGFSDSDVDKAIATGMSNAQLYKQAGNSIVVNVLMAIFEKMI